MASKWTGKTEIVTNAKHPVIAIVKLMGWADWKEEYSRKIMEDLDLKSKLKTEVNFMTKNTVTKSNKISKLSKILKELNLHYDESTETFEPQNLVAPSSTDALTQKPNVEKFLAENVKQKETILKLQLLISQIPELNISETAKNTTILNIF